MATEADERQADLEAHFAFRAPTCWWCHWYIGANECRAFSVWPPDVHAPIPMEIRSGVVPHTEPYPGDHGRHFVNRYHVQDGLIPAPEDW